jgi:hypothetical protein
MLTFPHDEASISVLAEERLLRLQLALASLFGHQRFQQLSFGLHQARFVPNGTVGAYFCRAFGILAAAPIARLFSVYLTAVERATAFFRA